MSLMNLLAPTYAQMLKLLSAWLAKAEGQQGGDADALLAVRLAPDMYPLATQIRFACVQAFEGVCRLQGEDFPPQVAAMLAEGQNGGERPGSIAEAQARINETLAMLEAVPLDGEEGDPTRPIAHRLPIGMIFDMTAERYARDWALPQFYFHLMIAYAILRNQGVDLGKADYVTHMFQYLRPGTMPG